MEIKRQYVVDDDNHKVAVQLDLQTFEKIEEILENHGLVQFMSNEDEEEALELADAKEYFEKLGLQQMVTS